jgi:ribosomal 50S subunit-recycling heat shock protein
MSSGREAPSRKGDGIRLDVFLKNAGILKRRSMAQSFCEAGAISVNDSPAKSGRWVHEGDRILVDSWNRRLLLLVLTLPKKGAKRAEPCYEIIEDERKTPEDAS